ncbi:hypothetical protein RRG08_063041 [Elysia crispata]|uniref:Uncharacterized protein n=1 Tax=Elysia crispata TaxID=231223 RepID=A0AAE1CNL4_9GAST|nr:hypothetical protein RRG08_063041 [Elysia crispata]
MAAEELQAKYSTQSGPSGPSVVRQHQGINGEVVPLELGVVDLMPSWFPVHLEGRVVAVKLARKVLMTESL